MIPTKSCFRLGLLGCGIAICLILNACAATVQAPTLSEPYLDWPLRQELPSAIRTSLQNSTMQQIPTGKDFVIPVRVFGPKGLRPPLLMIHGLQSHSGWFGQSAAFLASLGYPVYVIDRRGSGLSQVHRGDTKDFKDWIEDIEIVSRRAMQLHGHSQVYVLGHCFGAIPATLYAAMHPHDVKSLLLTTPGIYTHTTLPFSQMLKIATTLPGKRNYYFPVPLDPEEFSELPEYEPFIARDPLALRAVSGDLYWQIYKARKQINALSDQLTMPLFVGYAGKDSIADNDKSQRWLATVPALVKTEISYPDARHILEFSLDRDRYFMDLQHWLMWQEER